MPTRKLTACVVLATAFLLGGCGINLDAARTLTLEVDGIEGTKITGEYILTADGTTTRHPLDEELPFSLEFSGQKVSCVVQKLGGEGSVRVRLLIDGVLVAFASTRDPYGNASAATP